MAKELKTLLRSELERKFKEVEGGVFVTYAGLNSEKIYEMRTKLRAKGAKLHVIKNSTAIRAFKTLGYDEKKLEGIFKGPLGVVYSPKGGQGFVGAAKALDSWKSETKDKLVNVKGGFFEGTVLDPAGVKAYKDLPSKEQLLGMLAGTLQAPISAFANRLHEVMAKFAYAVNAVKEKKEKSGEK
jgi:large subunit ribosomal protein L10